MESAQQLYAQRVWTRYVRAFRKGGTDNSAFERQLEGVVGPRLRQMFDLRSRLLQLTSHAGEQHIPDDLLARCICYVDSLEHLDADSRSESADADSPHSMYLRLMKAALLKELAVRGRADARRVLSLSSPPFGSWTTSAPISEDDWLDPKDEVIVPEHMFAWDAQVGCVWCLT